MTRLLVYSTAVAVFVAATTMTITAILLPTWITFSSPTTGTQTLGLHRSCTTTTLGTHCNPFPQAADCHGSDRYFCSMWRSVGFLMSFAAVFELVTIVAYVVVMVGGKQKRETGWKVVVFMLVLVGVVQCAAMAIVAYLFDNDDRFFVGWKLDDSWILCTVSWCIALVSAALLSLSAFVLDTEGGYELIPSERYGAALG